MAEQMKVCKVCHRSLPVEMFPPHRREDRPGQYRRGYCRDCKSPQSPEKSRQYSLKKRYGLTPERFDEMLLQQGGCAACGSATTNGKYWHVDHDHTCCPSSTRTCGGCIRGVLCHGCNTALGNLDDSPQKVRSLLAYIERHAA